MVKEVLILIPDDLEMDEYGTITRPSRSYGYSVNANDTIPERLYQEGMFLIAAGDLLRAHQQKEQLDNADQGR